MLFRSVPIFRPSRPSRAISTASDTTRSSVSRSMPRSGVQVQSKVSGDGIIVARRARRPDQTFAAEGAGLLAGPDAACRSYSSGCACAHAEPTARGGLMRRAIASSVKEARFSAEKLGA